MGVLAELEYDNLGRRTALHRADNAGVTTTYAYDAASRLASLQQDIAGTPNDPNFSFTYNAAGQALSRTGASAYAWPQPSASAVSYTANGRNQYASVGGTNFSYDARGNLTATGSAAYGYDAFNRLTSAGSATLSYDPAGRLHQTTSNGSTVTARFLYDGLDVIAEYDGSNVLQRRYVHGPGLDEPLVEYVGGERRWLVSDQLGSVVAVTNASGASLAVNTYDEYGQPGASNSGRFQYTGQMWIAEAGLYHYKARAYAPALGRFLQTDPIGYAGGMNLCRCVLNDPVNLVDPLGLDEDDIIVPGSRHHSEQQNLWDIWTAAGMNPPNPDVQLISGEKKEERPERPADPAGREGTSLDDCEKSYLSNFSDPTLNFSDQTLNSVRLHVGQVPSWLPQEYQGVTLGRDIYLRPGAYDPSTPTGLALLAHEIVHVEQYARGMTVPYYLLEALGHGYRDHPAEVAAFDIQARVLSELQSMPDFAGCPW